MGRGSLPTRVLCRALLAWGLGHLTLGLRRGWLLLGAEIAVVALLGVGLVPRAQGTLSDLVFSALVLFFVAWAAQVVDAYRRAVAGAAATSDRAPLLLLTLVVPATVVFTVFWLVGGSAATPTSALQQYVADWRSGDAARACEHVVDGIDAAAVQAGWTEDEAYIEGRVRALAAELGPGSGLDPEHPFASLGFTLDSRPVGDSGAESGEAGEAGETASAAIDVVRQTTVREAFLGLFPAASQRSVAVERVGTIRLRLVELPAPFGIGPPDRAWRVEGVSLGPLP